MNLQGWEVGTKEGKRQLWKMDFVESGGTEQASTVGARQGRVCMAVGMKGTFRNRGWGGQEGPDLCRRKEFGCAFTPCFRHKEAIEGF